MTRDQVDAVARGRVWTGADARGAGLVDELLVYVAPRLIGPGLGLAALAPIARLDDALAFSFWSVERVGADLRLLLRPAAAPRPA